MKLQPTWSRSSTKRLVCADGRRWSQGIVASELRAGFSGDACSRFWPCGRRSQTLYRQLRCRKGLRRNQISRRLIRRCCW